MGMGWTTGERRDVQIGKNWCRIGAGFQCVRKWESLRSPSGLFICLFVRSICMLLLGDLGRPRGWKHYPIGEGDPYANLTASRGCVVTPETVRD